MNWELENAAMLRTRLIGLLLVLLTLMVYWPVGSHGFVLLDDQEYVVNNRSVNSGLTWAGCHWALTSFYACNWHPLTWLSHALDCELFGLDAGAHHLVNVLLHGVNAALLFGWLWRMTGVLGRSAFVAALFAWHPLHVESVAWVAERKDVLSTLFGLLALLAYARFGKEGRHRYFWVAWFFFALGLMAKPMLVTLPFVLLLVDYWPAGRTSRQSWRELVLEKWPFFLLTAVSCVMTYLAQRAEAVKSLAQYPLDLRVENAVLSYARYLFKTVWPVDLAIIYPYPQRLPVAPVAAAGLLLATVSWLAWRERKQFPYLLVGWLCFLGMLVPVIGLVQVGQQAMADRYSYFPLVGLFIAAVWGAPDLVRRLQIPSRLLAVTGVLLLAVCALVTRAQLRHWRDDESLFSHAVAVTQDNSIAHINLGFAYERQGRRAEAKHQYEEALRITPNSVEAHVSLGNFAADAGDAATAFEHYQTALRLNPKVADARNNLGTLLVDLGRFDEAMQQYAESARLQPTDPRPHYLMGKAGLRRGDTAAAITHFREALRRDPEEIQTLVFLARVLASDPDPRFRNGAEAVTLAERANALRDGSDVLVLDTLAMAYAEAGRLPEAGAVMARAIALTDAAGARDVMTELQVRLKLYQSGQPYREPRTNTPAPISPRN